MNIKNLTLKKMIVFIAKLHERKIDGRYYCTLIRIYDDSIKKYDNESDDFINFFTFL